MSLSQRTTRLLSGTILSATVLGATLSASAASDFVRTFRIEPARYLGTWYELARTPNDFEDNSPEISGVKYGPCFNSQATYTQVNDFTIGVTNQCERPAASGTGSTKESVTGTALVVPKSDNRKLKVAFGPWIARLFQRLITVGGADYWIYGIGPVGEDGKYTWALVSNADRSNIFVLSRDKDPSDEVREEILDLAEEEGLPAADLIYTQR